MNEQCPGSPSQEGVLKPSLYASPGLGRWLDEAGGSIAFTTYQSGRLLIIASAENGQTSTQERLMGPAMGLAVDPQGFWIANKQQVWRFSNIGSQRLGRQCFDAVYMPRKGYFVGPSDVHDILANVNFRGGEFELLFVNTQYSCIAAADDHYSFRPLWKPPFVSSIAAGDRCHLNGMCVRDGHLAYVTLCGRSDTPGGWRAVKGDGGCVLDIASGESICGGLSMPHSPRWYRGRLWLLNSGAGDFGYLDLSDGRFVPVGQCPGFARGLCFVGDHAVIGISRLRESAFAAGLPLVDRLEKQHVRQICGLLVIDIRTGALAHWLTIEGVVDELYDVAFLAGVKRPYTPGFAEPQLQQALVFGPDGELAISSSPDGPLPGSAPSADGPAGVIAAGPNP